MLKKSLMFVLLPVVLLACGGGGQKATITGKLKNAKGTTLILEVVENNVPRAVDSATVGDDGTFSLSLPYGKRSFYRVKSSADKNSLVILCVDSTENVSIGGDATRLYETYIVKGSPTSEQIEKFFRGLDKINAQLAELEKEMRGFNAADTARGMELGKKYNELMQERIDFATAFVDANQRSAAAYLAVNILKLDAHFDYFKKIQAALHASMPNSAYENSIATDIGKMEYQKQQMEAMQQQMEEKLKEIRKLHPAGSTPPEIAYTNPDGKVIKLSSLKGKVVLVDFWASWCRPCRAENPNVVRMYNRYKDKGFTVYSVSLDNNKEAWVKAIAQDGLIWPNHVSELKQWQSSVVTTYGIGGLGIPFTVLLGKDGKVIDVGLRGETLEQKLAELLDA